MGLVVNVVFDKEHLSAIYLRLAALPKPLSEIKMSDGEDDPRYPVTFGDLAKNKKVPVSTAGGYFLHAQDASYGVRFFNNEAEFFIGCSTDEAALDLMRSLATFPIIFGYAGQFEEREHQNRIVAKKLYGSHETWVGRDYTRYLPGLYWLNLIPKSLLERHGIPESAIKSIAISFQEVGDKNFLIQLYPFSSDWKKHTAKLDEWRKQSPGVFYKEAAEKALMEASTFLEASDATREWK